MVSTEYKLILYIKLTIMMYNKSMTALMTLGKNAAWRNILKGQLPTLTSENQRGFVIDFGRSRKVYVSLSTTQSESESEEYIPPSLRGKRRSAADSDEEGQSKSYKSKRGGRFDGERSQYRDRNSRGND